MLLRDKTFVEGHSGKLSFVQLVVVFLSSAIGDRRKELGCATKASISLHKLKLIILSEDGK